MSTPNRLAPPPEAGQYHHLIPPERLLDPVEATWIRGLIVTALELRLMPMCWHISRAADGVAVATGYATVTRSREDALRNRNTWANELGLRDDGAGGYAGQTGALRIHLPDATDPDEHCRVCGEVMDPRSTDDPPDRRTYDRHVRCA